MMLNLLPFKHIVAVDTEFEFGGHATLEEAKRSGERPRPVCVVAKELRSGQTWRTFRGEFGSQPPFPTGSDTLMVAYYASAELGTFKALNWPLPVYVLDLFTEFRVRTNGLHMPLGSGLLAALAYFGIVGIDLSEKKEMILLILSGGPWTPEQRAAIIKYCESDVLALECLLLAMAPDLDLTRALLRGRFMRAAAIIEWNGTPIDTARLQLWRRHWTGIQDDLIAAIDCDYGVFDGRSFREESWQQWLSARDIPWPIHASGHLDLSDDTFRQMARAYPEVAPMRELRGALSGMRLEDLAVGEDGRNRTILSAFRSSTSRCQPSNKHYIFGPAVWLRSLIKPPPGYGIAYTDWNQQEFGIAAALSGDPAMIAAYLSGDPYLEFAKQAGAIPAHITVETKGPYKAVRELYKQCSLAVLFGQGVFGLAQRIGKPEIVARELLRLHRQTYSTFWAWSDAAVDHAMLKGSIQTVFGWTVHTDADPNPRSLRNFPMQANGAEMLRLAACFGTEQGIEICALIHDAVLVCAPLERLDADIAQMRECMALASRILLDGFELRTDVTNDGKDVHLVRYPNHYQDSRGTVMRDRVMQLVTAREAATRRKVSNE